ncbi:MAG TPA: DUF924 family protein [Fredinandcohnia sp.]|nr:DUF924 family protein [Fredinandcohnia sp.]
MERAEEILQFWFGELDEGGWDFDPARYDLWFGKSPETDRVVTERFGEDARAAAEGRLDPWAETPRGRLALVLLLDQFPRHIHRGKPEAWAQDPKAQRIVLEGLARGHDQALRPIERSFFYLPLEHAEDAALQARSVALYRALAEAAPEAVRARYASFLDYAIRHQVIIDRFGRFPHRNAILGRQSTPEEEAFLLEPGSSF